jgi:rhamnosyltransferase
MNGEKYMESLLTALENQTLKPLEILVVDSASTDRTVEIVKAHEEVQLLPIERKDFDHGKTRDMALRKTKGDYVLFLTQDAEIEDDRLLEKMRQDFRDDTIAVVSARQLPKKDATRREQLIRAFNYPDQSTIRSSKDLEKLGIKTYFMSDVCSMYRKDIYLKVGGFTYPIKTNEDMFYAAAAINAGYRIVYDAYACVLHSHNFTLKQQYERNYIQGYEIEKHKELLHHVSQTSEGMKLVKYVTKRLLKEGHFFAWVYFGFDCIARFTGSRKGRKAAREEAHE